MDRVKQLEEIQNKTRELFAKKNADYGDDLLGPLTRNQRRLSLRPLTTPLVGNATVRNTRRVSSPEDSVEPTEVKGNLSPSRTRQRSGTLTDFLTCSEPPVHAGDSSKLSFFSLFAGCGGMDLGFELAGMRCAYAVDNDKDCVDTFVKNFGRIARCTSVKQVDKAFVESVGVKGVNVIIGGPPCQGFSVAGEMRLNDGRSKLVFEFARIVSLVQPEAFVMENVKSLAELSKFSSTRKNLLHKFETAGYNVEMKVLRADEYGVPQARERVFFIGFRKDLSLKQADIVQFQEEAPTVRETFQGLPLPGNPGNEGECKAKVQPAKNPILRKSGYDGSLLFNGQGRPLRLDGVAKTLPASMGGNATPIIDQDQLSGKTNSSWVETYHSQLLQGKRPIKQAPSHMRRITVTEAALLQSFPKDFKFPIHNIHTAYHQIGNAVPPLLAKAVGLYVLARLGKA